MKKLAKHDPPRTLNIPARPLYFIYYSVQPMSWAIIILSIFCSLGCFFVIPPHRVNNAVHLHIADQFIFSYTTPLCFFTFITRPLFFFLFFSFTWDYHRHIPFFSPFCFVADISAIVVIFTWVSVFLSIYHNLLVLYDSCFFLLVKYISSDSRHNSHVSSTVYSLLLPSQRELFLSYKLYSWLMRATWISASTLCLRVMAWPQMLICRLLALQ